jgi:POT family proton-dependent oligopeptide transporter
LALIVLGTGLLKPNVSTMVGSLYEENDTRRDAGFSIFYMGINLGSVLGVFIAGYLAQKVDWHIGFACAGFGMALGLAQYILGRKHLKPAMERLAIREKQTVAGAPTTQEWRRLATIAILFVFAALFWGAYEQAGSTLNLFADRYTRLDAFGFSIPSSWFQLMPGTFVVILAPIMAALWVRLGKYEPSSPAKFAIGLLFAGLSFLFLVPAARIAQSGPHVRVSPLWLIGAYFIIEIGELSLSPVGLNVVTKLAPARIVGLMMGVWLLSIAVGDKIAGWAAGLFSTMPLPSLFGYVAAATLAGSVILAVLVKPIKKLATKGTKSTEGM